MKKIITLYKSISNKISNLDFIALLAIRFILAYGFYEPAKNKISNINSIAEWFKSMELPFPLLQAYLATYTEIVGVILLTLGFATRLISIPLMIIMLVAIKTVHWENGFAAGENGFEIPLYYLFMLLAIFTQGAGKASIDYLIKTKIKS
ncbi:MAG: hypothetical protein RLZZ175_1628 [Bacteroidota bacterium]|jgi:putative oxidoreductase